MPKVFTYVVWIIQLVCLVTILLCAWQVLEREVFGLVAASIVLAATLYLEHGFVDQDFYNDREP